MLGIDWHKNEWLWKWPMENRIVTWPTTSRDSEKSSHEPNTLRSISRKQNDGDAVWQQSLLLLHSLLWGSGSTVGCPSDSLASCLVMVRRIWSTPCLSCGVCVVWSGCGLWRGGRYHCDAVYNRQRGQRSVADANPLPWQPGARLSIHLPIAAHVSLTPPTHFTLVSR